MYFRILELLVIVLLNTSLQAETTLSPALNLEETTLLKIKLQQAFPSCFPTSMIQQKDLSYYFTTEEEKISIKESLRRTLESVKDNEEESAEQNNIYTCIQELDKSNPSSNKAASIPSESNSRSAEYILLKKFFINSSNSVEATSPQISISDADIGLAKALFKHSDIEIKRISNSFFEEHINDRRVQDALIPYLNDSDHNTRISAIRILSLAILEHKVQEAIFPILKETNFDILLTTLNYITYAVNSPEVYEALLPLLKNPNSEIRSTVLYILSKVSNEPKVQEAIFDLLKDPESKDIIPLLRALEKASTDQKVQKVIIPFLRNPNPEIRSAALSSLANAILDSNTLDIVIPLLKDPNPRIRNSAVYGLTNTIKNPKVQDAVLPSLNDIFVVYTALSTLSKALTEQKVQQAFLQLLQNSNYEIQRSTVEYLSDVILEPKVWDVLTPLLKNSNSYIKLNLLSSLQKQINEPKIQNLIISLLDDFNLRIHAINSLAGAIKEPNVQNVIIPYLKDHSFEIVSNTLLTLSNAINESIVQEAIIPLLHHSNYMIKKRALETLKGAIQQPEVQIAILPLLKDPHKEVRTLAVQVLKNVSHQPSVAKALSALLNNSSLTFNEKTIIFCYLSNVPNINTTYYINFFSIEKFLIELDWTSSRTPTFERSIIAVQALQNMPLNQENSLSLFETLVFWSQRIKHLDFNDQQNWKSLILKLENIVILHSFINPKIILAIKLIAANSNHPSRTYAHSLLQKISDAAPGNQFVIENISGNLF